MRVVDRETFLALPPNMLYSKFEPNCFSSIEIKAETLTDANGKNIDWYSVDIASSIVPADTDQTFDDIADELMAGKSMPVCFDVIDRDGFYDEDQLFAVWEPEDIRVLIDRLSECLG